MLPLYNFINNVYVVKIGALVKDSFSEIMSGVEIKFRRFVVRLSS
jgi:hypothetical protein